MPESVLLFDIPPTVEAIWGPSLDLVLCKRLADYTCDPCFSKTFFSTLSNTSDISKKVIDLKWISQWVTECWRLRFNTLLTTRSWKWDLGLYSHPKGSRRVEPATLGLPGTAPWPLLEFLKPITETVLFEPRHEKTCLCHMRPTKVQISLRSLISTFVVHCLDSIVSLVSIFVISWL